MPTWMEILLVMVALGFAIIAIFQYKKRLALNAFCQEVLNAKPSCLLQTLRALHEKGKLNQYLTHIDCEALRKIVDAFLAGAQAQDFIFFNEMVESLTMTNFQKLRGILNPKDIDTFEHWLSPRKLNALKKPL